VFLADVIATGETFNTCVKAWNPLVSTLVFFKGVLCCIRVDKRYHHSNALFHWLSFRMAVMVVTVFQSNKYVPGSRDRQAVGRQGHEAGLCESW
jgi:hypothetical protein